MITNSLIHRWSRTQQEDSQNKAVNKWYKMNMGVGMQERIYGLGRPWLLTYTSLEMKKKTK
uniref:Uncharacterized protein n=1 Tax=Arion vulgaris TaxID=1028688 RepID=A0A0B7A1K2_9EUPU